ncbi:MAG TPA: CDP-alcohol phosphatidyltransferase family protein [Candidatus Saccharimonadales bacterium]|nr:CDP-alcohol phosphatidyltransferase family protein [Candidatus Saccharimonadales bacterium]
MNKLLPYAIAAVRFDQARRLYNKIGSDEPIEGLGALICATDVGDGILMRALNADGPMRRVLDSVNDAVVLAAGFAALYQKNENARPYIKLLLAREAFVAGGYLMDLAHTRQVKKGDKFHKLASISIASFAITASHTNKPAMHITGAAAVGINGVLAADYFKGWAEPESNILLGSGVQEVPGFRGIRALLHNRGLAAGSQKA